MFKKIFLLLDIRQQRKQLLFIILVFFLIAFALARAYSVYTHRSVFIHGYQIHHFYFGTFILACSSIIALLNKGENIARFASMLAGIGIGLFADELGLLLNCTTINRACGYYFPDYLDFIGTIATIIFILIIFAKPPQTKQQKNRNQPQQ